MSNTANFDKKMTVQSEEDNNILWLNIDDKRLRVKGFPFYNQDKKLCRLPQHILPKMMEINPDVVELSYHTAGGKIYITTNSKELWIKVVLNNAPYMSHFTPCGQCGVDCYAKKENSNEWIFSNVSKFKIDSSEFTCKLVDNINGKFFEYMINLPLYIGIKNIEIGIESTAKCKIIEKNEDKSIVFYGTSITQGGCASRPGMTYPAIIGRSLNIETYNLGFSGNGMAYKEVAEVIADIANMEILVIDVEHNAGEKGLLETNLPIFIDTIRNKKPLLAIIVMSGTHTSKEEFDKKYKKDRETWKNFQKNHVKETTLHGDERIFYINPEEFYGCDTSEITVDGIHLTDLGFSCVANGFLPILNDILSEDN